MVKIYALVNWEDAYISIIDVSAVVNPRKNIDKYKEGDYVMAKFGGQLYKARISELGQDINYLKDRTKSELKNKYLKRPLDTINESEDSPIDSTYTSPNSSSDEDNDNHTTEEVSDGASSEGTEVLPNDEQSAESDNHKKADEEKFMVNHFNVSAEAAAEKKIRRCRHCQDSCRCEDLKRLEDELQKVKARLNALQRPSSSKTVTSSPARPPISQPRLLAKSAITLSPSEDIPTVDELLGVIKYTSPQNVAGTVKLLLLHCFAEKTLRESSYSGKKTIHSPGVPKPPLNPERLQVIEQAFVQHTGLPHMVFVLKLQNTIKYLRDKERMQKNSQ